MQFFITSTVFISLVPLLVGVSAIPITPAAPDAQHLAEQMRAEGASEVNHYFLPFLPIGEPFVCFILTNIL